jgi:hypothetical protein
MFFNEPHCGYKFVAVVEGPFGGGRPLFIMARVLDKRPIARIAIPSGAPSARRLQTESKR